MTSINNNFFLYYSYYYLYSFSPPVKNEHHQTSNTPRVSLLLRGQHPFLLRQTSGPQPAETCVRRILASNRITRIRVVAKIANPCTRHYLTDICGDARARIVSGIKQALLVTNCSISDITGATTSSGRIESDRRPPKLRLAPSMPREKPLCT